jgi:hypothetical protein
MQLRRVEASCKKNLAVLKKTLVVRQRQNGFNGRVDFARVKGETTGSNAVFASRSSVSSVFQY